MRIRILDAPQNIAIQNTGRESVIKKIVLIMAGEPVNILAAPAPFFSSGSGSLSFLSGSGSGVFFKQPWLRELKSEKGPFILTI